MNSVDRQPEALRLADALQKPVLEAMRHRHPAAAELRRLHYERESLRADAERGRWLVDWLKRSGLVSVLFCQPGAGMRAEDWFVFWRPYGVDRTRSPEGYAKTPEGAIDAARAANEKS